MALDRRFVLHSAHGLECDIVHTGLECDIVHTGIECDIVYTGLSVT